MLSFVTAAAVWSPHSSVSSRLHGGTAFGSGSFTPEYTATTSPGVGSGFPSLLEFLSWSWMSAEK